MQIDPQPCSTFFSSKTEAVWIINTIEGVLHELVKLIILKLILLTNDK